MEEEEKKQAEKEESEERGNEVTMQDAQLPTENEQADNILSPEQTPLDQSPQSHKNSDNSREISVPDVPDQTPLEDGSDDVEMAEQAEEEEEEGHGYGLAMRLMKEVRIREKKRMIEKARIRKEASMLERKMEVAQEKRRAEIVMGEKWMKRVRRKNKDAREKEYGERFTRWDTMMVFLDRQEEDIDMRWLKGGAEKTLKEWKTKKEEEKGHWDDVVDPELVDAYFYAWHENSTWDVIVEKDRMVFKA